MLPAWQSTKTDLVPALKNEATSERTRHWHVRDYLVATQIGLSALLLVCSVLVVKSLQRAMEAPFGYQPKGAVTTSYDLNLSGYDENRGREFHRRLLEKVRATPGVDYAALADWLPLSVNNNNDSIFIQGKPVPKSNEAPIAYSFSVSPDFFESMGTRLLAGRAFTLRDNKDVPPTAVVNQAFVDQLLPGEQPLGKRFGFGPEGPWLEIIGVVETGKYFSLTEDRRPAVFTSLERRYSANVSLVARTSAGEQGILRAVKQTIAELDPNVALYSSGTMTEMLDMPLFPARLAAGALGAFGLLAAILAAAGIYGIMAYSVSRRAREIGIRIAIGANASQVLTVIARRAAILIGAGTILGLAAAWFVGRQLGAILYGVNATDPLTYALVLVMMLAIAALACFVPARRAMRIDPITSLRQE
jgi:predicted permease